MRPLLREVLRNVLYSTSRNSPPIYRWHSTIISSIMAARRFIEISSRRGSRFPVNPSSTFSPARSMSYVKRFMAWYIFDSDVPPL